MRHAFAIFLLWAAVQVPAGAQPPAPTGLTVSPPFDGEANLSWDPEPTATVWEIFRHLAGSPTPDPTATPVATVPAWDTPAFRDVQVTNGREYRFEVRGRDAGGAGASSAVTASPHRIPDAVATVVIQRLRTGVLDLSWKEPFSSHPVSFYEIFRSALVPTPTPTPLGDTPTFTPTPTGTWNTPTPTPSFTPPPPVPASTVLTAAPTPLATTVAPAFFDQEAGSLGAWGIYYVVRAVDSEGRKGFLPALSSKPEVPALLPPSPPSVSASVEAVLGYGVRLFWSGHAPVEGVTHYEVRRDGTPIATLGATPTETHVYHDGSAPFADVPAVGLAYRVRAHNPYGATDSEAVTAFVTKAQAPVSFQVTPAAADAAVTLSWAPSGAGSYGLSGYRLFRGTSGAPPAVHTPFPGASPTATPSPTPFATVPATPGATATQVFVHSGVSNAHGWSYWISPFDDLNLDGVAGRPTPERLLLAPTPPSVPTVQLTPVNNRVHVSWTDAAPAFYGPKNSTTVYRRVLTTPTPEAVAVVPWPTTSYVDAVPGGAGTPVVYSLAVQDAPGNLSDRTADSAAITLQGPAPPPAPTASLATGDGSTLTFRWLLNPTPDAVEGYEVYGSDFPTLTVTPTPLAVVTPTPTEMFWTEGGLTPWEAAFRYLVARNAAGPGAPATLSGIPVPAYQVTAEVTPGVREVRVSWTAVPTPGSTPPIDAFVVHRSLAPGAGFTPVATVPPGTPGWIDAGAQAGVVHYYRITAKAGTEAESPLFPTLTPVPEADVPTWPKAPSGFSAEGGVVETLLSWFGNAGSEQVLDYGIERGGTPLATVEPSPTMEWRATETPGMRSAYALTARNASGASEAAGPLTVLSAPWVTPTIALTPPPAATPTPRRVWISNLSYPGDVSAYAIYRSTDPGFIGETLQTVQTGPQDYASDGGVPGFVNYYRAVARDASGLEADRNSHGPLTIALWPNPPGTPTPVGDSGAVTLAWEAPAGNTSVTGYHVYRSTAPGWPKTLIAAVPEPTREVVDASVNSGTAYYYQVDASGTGGPGDPSAEVGFLVLDPPVLGATPGVNAVTLAWTQAPPPEPNDQAGYAVFRRLEPTPEFAQIAFLTGITPTPYVDASVSSGATYVYRVAASTSSGVHGPPSAPITQAVLPPPVFPSAASGDGLVQLRWAFQGAGFTYAVQRRLGAEPDSAFETVAEGVTGSNYKDTGILNKTLYVYRVVTVDSQGITAVSAAVEALPARPPVVPDRTVQAAPGEAGVTLTWSAANPPGSFDATAMYPLGGYRILRSEDGGATWAEVGTAGAGASSFFDPVPMVGGTARTYLVRAFDAPPDNPGMVHETPYDPVVVQPLSAKTSLDRNSLRPFGAPGEDTVNIRFVLLEPGEVTLRVYTLSGTFVRELVRDSFPAGVHWTSWDGRNAGGDLVASGVYLITTKMPGRKEVSKIAVIK